MQIDQRRAALRYRNKVNNAQGHFLEDYIKAGCALYSRQGRAEIDKTPEPFRVMEKLGGGGSLTMAGAQFQDADVHEVAERLRAAIEEYLAASQNEAENVPV